MLIRPELSRVPMTSQISASNLSLRWPVWLRWPGLIVLSVALMFGLEALNIPAALLLGPMLGAIVLATTGGAVKLSRPVFALAQGVVGTMIAQNLPPTVFHEIALKWPIFLAGVMSTLLASSLLGWILMRSKILPGTTAIWGSAPGAASVMTLMSEAYGADMRLVAFMQYVRVAACAIVATIVSGMLGSSGGSHAAQDWLPGAAVWRDGIWAVGIAIAGGWIGWRFRIPGGPMLLPMVIGMAVKLSGIAPVELPMPVLALCYAIVGWGIGMRFTTDVLRHAARVFPRVIASILILIAISGLFGAGLVVFAGLDPVTAYLATSPGGADSVAIIASSMKVDVPFVMSMQVARFLAVLFFGPMLARLLSRGRQPS